MSEIREKYIILLLGALESPIPTIWHVQKEFFILSKIQPKFQDLFHFVKHYEGPYSQLLQESVKEPVFYIRPYEFDSNDAFYLTDRGKVILDSIRHEYARDDRFVHLDNTLKIIRSIYDRLSKNELLFLIYVTYPEYTELSIKYDSLVKNVKNRKTITSSLLEKGLITKDRYEELINIAIQ